MCDLKKDKELAPRVWRGQGRRGSSRRAGRRWARVGAGSLEALTEATNRGRADLVSELAREAG